MAPSPPTVRFFKLSRPAEYVAHVEINRPEKLNAFHDAMWHEMKAVFEHLSCDPDVRCVLISGAGLRAFTAGTCTQFRPRHFRISTSLVLNLALPQVLMSLQQRRRVLSWLKGRTHLEKPTFSANTFSIYNLASLLFHHVRSRSLL